MSYDYTYEVYNLLERRRGWFSPFQFSELLIERVQVESYQVDFFYLLLQSNFRLHHYPPNIIIITMAEDLFSTVSTKLAARKQGMRGKKDIVYSSKKARNFGWSEHLLYAKINYLLFSGSFINIGNNPKRKESENSKTKELFLNSVCGMEWMMICKLGLIIYFPN